MANTPQTDAPKKRRWVKYLLFVSLALNLLVVGVVAGAIYRGGPGHGAPPHVARGDLGLGPYGKALSPRDQRVLRMAFIKRSRANGGQRPNIRAEMQAVLAALRQEPFDPGALRDTMGQQQARLVARQNIGKDVLLDHLAEMATGQRHDYADRLEGALGRLFK